MPAHNARLTAHWSRTERHVRRSIANAVVAGAGWPSAEVDNDSGVATNDAVCTHAEMFRHLREVRDETLEQARLLRQLATQRRELIHQLIEEGFSQADIARELGVTRRVLPWRARQRTGPVRPRRRVLADRCMSRWRSRPTRRGRPDGRSIVR
jgi:DNA-directed RNA polymerase specialized sigma24 family protein